MRRALPLLLASLLAGTAACSDRDLAEGGSDASTSAGMLEPAPPDPGGPLGAANVALRLAAARCDADVGCGGCTGEVFAIGFDPQGFWGATAHASLR